MRIPSLPATTFLLALGISPIALGNADPSPPEVQPNPLPEEAPSVQVAEGIRLFPGRFPESDQPDGNSILIDAPDGWILVDTGRHPDHTQRLLDAARALGKPIAAIVNTHWHLDHSSGDRRVREAFPEAPLITSQAIDGALKGFLANSLKRGEEHLAKGEVPPQYVARLKAGLQTIREGDWLRPTQPVIASGNQMIAGRDLYIGLSPHAVTEADVWLLDPKTRTLISGDLVTLPAPLFDTACPASWRHSLDELDTKDFETLVPGHGAPMTHAEFHRYREAFDALLDCAADNAQPRQCMDAWTSDLGSLLPSAQHGKADELLEYYIEQRLRAPPEQHELYCNAGHD